MVTVAHQICGHGYNQETRREKWPFQYRRLAGYNGLWVDSTLICHVTDARHTTRLQILGTSAIRWILAAIRTIRTYVQEIYSKLTWFTEFTEMNWTELANAATGHYYSLVISNWSYLVQDSKPRFKQYSRLIAEYKIGLLAHSQNWLFLKKY